jgi:hypothetical protein
MLSSLRLCQDIALQTGQFRSGSILQPDIANYFEIKAAADTRASD